MTTRKLWLTYLILILALGLVLTAMLHAFLGPVLPALAELGQTISASYVSGGDSSLVCPARPARGNSKPETEVLCAAQPTPYSD